jgi:hypothetical protein
MSPAFHVLNEIAWAGWTVILLRYIFPWLNRKIGIPGRRRPRLLPTCAYAATLCAIWIAADHKVITGLVAAIANGAVIVAFWLTWPSDDDDDDKRKKRLKAALRRAKTYLVRGIPARRPATA